MSDDQEPPPATSVIDPVADPRQHQFSALLAHSPDAIVILDADGRICEWNPAAEALFGWPRDEILQTPVDVLVPPEGLTHFEQVWTDTVAGGAPAPAETVRLHRDGTRLRVSLRIAPIREDGVFAGAVTTLRGLLLRDEPRRAAARGSEPEQSRGRAALGRGAAPLESALSTMERDELTGLPGRRGLQRRLAQPVPVGQERGVAVLDVDAFALINQTYGPDSGDDVLRELARRLRDAGGAAVVGRWQADEFVCIVDAADPAAALDELSSAMLRSVRAPFPVGDDRLQLTVSAGLVTGALAPFVELLRSAMEALRAAKEAGRDRAVWFDAAQRPASGGGLRLANDLHQGIDRDELRLHFQPIVQLATNEVTGVEALVRWERPGVGLLGPASFIDVAERTGQIVPLGAWVARRSCRAAVEIAAMGGRPRRVSINLSARQLSDPGLVTMLGAALAESGCPASSLIVEVTESALMHDMNAAAVTLEAIKALGVGLDLDDFGTGYSSLLYLKHFPVDRIKIDRSFVGGLGTEAADTAIVASTIALAHSVGMEAVAEGVETAEQLALLRQMGCDFAQGYLLSRPVVLDELHRWLSAHVPAQRQGRDVAQGGTAPTVTGGRNQVADQRDQVADQRDQAGDQRDQAGDERDHVGDERDHVGDQRDDVAEQRDEVAEQRDQAAEQRDLAAERRDLAAEQRDQAAEQRDHLAEQRDQVADRRDEGATGHLDALDRHQDAHDGQAGRRRVDRPHVPEMAETPPDSWALARLEAASDRTRASQDREAGASERTQAELDRETALADREAGATERTQAELDRNSALVDRGASAREREFTFVDALTGVYLPGPGLVELEHEMARARRTKQSLVVAVVDVVDLKSINESRGHAGGDSMLVEVANVLRATLRSYDLIFRHGGDEFVCALSGLSVDDATTRLALVNAALLGRLERGSVTVGYAQAQPGDSPEQLVERAEVAIKQERQARGRQP